MFEKRIVSLLAALCLFASLLTACGGKPTFVWEEPDDGEETVETSKMQNTEDTVPDGELETAPGAGEETEEQDEEPAVLFRNPLTGLETTEELSCQRPVAIMLNNIKAALPQIGISKVDVLYEITVEGAITRLLGVATDWASLPVVGSVRSSRDYFIDISDAHGAIYVHAGGSPVAYSTMSSRRTEHIDGTNGNAASTRAFYRDAERRKTMASEHTLVTSGERIAKAIADNGFSTVQKEDFVCPLQFADEAVTFEGEPALYIYIPFSYYAQSYLDYDAESGLYQKGQYLNTRSSLGKHDSPHIDGTTGEQLAFTNVLVLLAYHSGALDEKGRISVDFTGTGTGYYMTGGVCKKIVWEKESRTSSYSLYEEDGETPLLLSPGKSYVAIAPTGCSVTYSDSEPLHSQEG